MNTHTQTHEGGIAGEPGAEAHGGYTFCGLAAAVLCDGARGLDLPELLHWLCESVKPRGSVIQKTRTNVCDYRNFKRC